MKEKNQKIYFNLSHIKLTLILLLSNIQNTQTSTHHNLINTPIYIHANHQSIDILTNTLTITGNVVIQKKFINIYADKIIIKNSNEKNSKHIITAYGNPLILYYLKNNKNQILITSSYLLYNETNHIIILRGHAFLKIKNNTVQSNCIIYMIKKKYIETCNKNNEHTKTIIIIDNKQHKNKLHKIS